MRKQHFFRLFYGGFNNISYLSRNFPVILQCQFLQFTKMRIVEERTCCIKNFHCGFISWRKIKKNENIKQISRNSHFEWLERLKYSISLFDFWSNFLVPVKSTRGQHHRVKCQIPIYIAVSLHSHKHFLLCGVVW